VEQREKRQIFTGGIMLIALGVLILLNSLGIYGFGKSWPILLIVIAAATLAQNVRDAVGWFIGAVGVVFLVVKNWYIHIGELTTYVLPVLLILLGIYMLFGRSKK
jgi:uncharacterized membrane protein YobD (UPF0266 family)